MEWGGKKKIVVNSKRPVPVITDPVRACNGCTCHRCSRATIVLLGLHVMAALGHNIARLQCLQGVSPWMQSAAASPPCFLLPQGDAIIKVTSTAICGSDLHMCDLRPMCQYSMQSRDSAIETFRTRHKARWHVLSLSRYLAAMPGMRKGDLLGHEVT